MRKFIYMAALAALTSPVWGQETYENAKIATEDLNGTARYVGMGGAMDALGADLSTISSNPAGIGLFRKSNASMSMGFVSQQGANDFGGGHTTVISFDQVGFVWANQISETDFVNFAFNYHKSRNFNHILSVADRLNNASLNGVTFEKQLDGFLYESNADDSPRLGSSPAYQCNQLDETLMQYTDIVWDGTTMGYYDATGYTMDRATKGYIGMYDFNLSGNVNNSFYWGITVGLHDVNYRHYGEYTENLIGDGIAKPQDYNLRVCDEREINGSGIDLKLGVIFRPIAESPLRFGISVATPTWYRLTTSNYTYLTDWGGRYNDGTAYTGGRARCENFSHDFKLFTPWKFGVSVGHTIGTNVALGASYEYSDYSALDSRIDYSNGWNEDSESDTEMNRHTENTLRGVSTLKLGAELKPVPELAVRLGYNYVSPMYEENGFKDQTIDSEGTSVSTATDFTNWEATHRITCGLGYQIGKWNISAAYQYATQKGNFEPFYYESPSDPDVRVEANKVAVNNKRHQLLFTLGYTF